MTTFERSILLINLDSTSTKFYSMNYQEIKIKSRLVDFDVGEDHDCQGPVEAHRTGEHQVADVLGEGALPGRRGAYRRRINICEIRIKFLSGLINISNKTQKQNRQMALFCTLMKIK